MDVDVEGVIKIATVYGDATFASNTTAARDAYTAYFTVARALTQRAKDAHANPAMIDYTVGNSTAPEQCDADTAVRSGSKRFRTSRYSTLYALWVINHPGMTLLSTFYKELANVQDGLSDMETTCTVACKALSSDTMGVAVQSLAAAFAVLGVSVV